MPPQTVDGTIKIYTSSDGVTYTQISSDATYITDVQHYCVDVKYVKLTGTVSASLSTPTSCIENGMFHELTSLKQVDMSGLEINSGITNFSYMFYECTALESIIFPTNFNTTNVTNMRSMFDSCYSLTSLNVSNFNTSNVTDMASMFSHCKILTTIDLSNFNTSNVVDMSRMFEECLKLTLLDLSSFNTSSVTNMKYMFNDCLKLKTIYVSDNFVTTAVTDSDNMFNSCESLIGVISYNSTKTDKTYANYTTGYFKKIKFKIIYGNSPITYNTNFFTTLSEAKTFIASSSVKTNTEVTYLKIIGTCGTSETSLVNLFNGCSSLTTIDLSEFNTASVTNMQNLFYNCTALVNLDLSNFDTSNVTTMQGMFYICRSLVTLNLSSFNTSKVINIGAMFRYCLNLVTIYVSDNFVTTSASGVDTFLYSSKLVGAIPFDSTKVDYTYANYTTGYFTKSKTNPVSGIEEKDIYIGVNNIATKVDKIYIGINNIATEVDKVYIGVNGIAKLIYIS